MTKSKMPKKKQKIPMKKKRKNGRKLGNPNQWRPPFEMEKVYIEFNSEGHTLIQLNSSKICFIEIKLISKNVIQYTTVTSGGVYYQAIFSGESSESKSRNQIRRTDWLTQQQKKDFYTAIDVLFNKHWENHNKWRKKKKMSLLPPS